MRIEDYALIGDLQTSALVGRNGLRGLTVPAAPQRPARPACAWGAGVRVRGRAG